MSNIEIIILFLIFVLFYIFLLYPIFLGLISRIFDNPLKIEPLYQPSVTFIIAAYNEESYIKEAIESIFSTGYPNNLIKVIVGSDGSTDKTVSVVKELQMKYNGISVFEFERSGKNSTLNQIVHKAETEIIMFMDADLRLQKDTLTECMNKFSDKSVGCVMCSLKIQQQGDNNNVGSFGEILYQKIESQIRYYESKIYTNVNSLGTLYGIRKDLFKQYPNDLVCDDLYTILSVSRIKQRVIFVPESEVIEIRQKSLKGEMKRRIRLVAGGLSTIWIMKRMLLPDYGWTSLFLLSHKLSRYLSPIILIILGLLTLFIERDSFIFLPLVYAQFILYITAVLGYLLEKIKIRFFLFRISLFFVTMNIGFLLGIIGFITRRQNAKWDRSYLFSL